MGDVLLILVVSLLLIAGILGAFLPILPGPPLSYAGLLVVHFFSDVHFSTRFLIIMGAITLVVTLIDIVLPVVATRKTGGSKRGMVGATLGLIVGLFFFPPIGIVLGPFLGAFLAELTINPNRERAFKSALGSLIGFFTGVFLKLTLSGIITWYAINPLFS